MRFINTRSALRTALTGLAAAGAIGGLAAAPQAQATAKPDLKIVEYRGLDGKVVVQNIGTAKAGASTLGISTPTAGGSMGGTASVPALAPGQKVTVYHSQLKSFCSGQTVTIDSKNVVAESNETNNKVTSECPN